MTTIEGQTLANITKTIRNIPNTTLDELANTKLWGTFGPDGVGPMRMRTLGSLDTEHLENILITQKQISTIYSAVILHILKGRYRSEITNVF